MHTHWEDRGSFIRVSLWDVTSLVYLSYSKANSSFHRASQSLECSKNSYYLLPSRPYNNVITTIIIPTAI